MDNYKEETTTKTTNRVTFSINQDGEIEFNAQGLEQWEVNEVISQVTTQAKQQQKATQTKQLTSLTSEVAMHGLALAFAALLVTGFTFTLSRIISGAIQQQPTTQLTND